MAILLLLIGFLGFVVASMQVQQIRFSIVKAILFFSLSILFTTEILSIFNSLNYLSLVIVWGFIAVVLLAFIIKRKLHHNLLAFKNKLKASLKSLSKLEKFLVVFVVFILVGVFLQGIIYPPNNWDALAYHMPRIIHWIQNESLANFRTPVYPQLISPPFSEQMILSVNLLLGNDYLSNAIQLFYLIGATLVLSMVAKQLGLNRLGQLFSVFIMMCLPEVILLASSTHTELVASFFMLCSLYFMLRILKQQDLLNFILLGISLGLGVATKSTAYVYLAPFVIVWLGVLMYQLVTKNRGFVLAHFLVLGLLFTAINLGHYSRNYQLSGNLFGTNSEIHNYYVNESHTFKGLLSNITRNLSNQFGVPKLAPLVEDLTVQFHQLIHQNINDPTTTSHTYDVDPLATHENNGANVFHILLILISVVAFVLFSKKINKRIKWFSIVIFLSFLLFCFYLKW